MTLKDKVILKMKKGHTEKGAQSLVAEDIIVEAISSSIYLDKVLFKGGVVMYNISKNERRPSTDYDWVGICSNKEVLNVIEDFLYSL